MVAGSTCDTHSIPLFRELWATLYGKIEHPFVGMLPELDAVMSVMSAKSPCTLFLIIYILDQVW